MVQNFEMVAKTMQGLENILAEELRSLGAHNVEPGLRMVSFTGDLEMLYKANFCCRTALRILKPFYKFYASSPEELYERAKEFDWSDILGLDKTFVVNTVAHSEEFSHSRYATYRVKDAISDWFRDRYGDKRPRVSTVDPDIIINLHISGNRITLSLDSSGESLHKRGYRVSQTEAPINEVLAAGIILLSGWRGETPFIDPMCGSGTFLIEAALIAANINPGIYRSHFAFEKWKDFNPEIFDKIYNDDSGEKEITVPIIGADISPKAVAVADRNLKNARIHKYITLLTQSLNDWDAAPSNGMLITNPPYGERLNPRNLDELYALLGRKLKNVFKGYHAWIIGFKDEHFAKISLAPSQKIPIYNGALECRLQEYIIFEGTKREFRQSGGDIKKHLRATLDNRQNRLNLKHKKDGISDGQHQHRPTKNQSTPGERFRHAFERADNTQADKNTGVRRDRFSQNQYPFTKPSLPPGEGPIMRERRAGWRKSRDWMNNNDDDNSNN